MYAIDFNSDIGESFGAYKLGNDEEILKYITACNVACGWHAGDPVVMDRVVKTAAELGVKVGAHPGYPDLMGFGRRQMKLSFAEAKNYVKYQVGALSAFTAAYGLKIHHVAPHGAMGNMCQDDRGLARAVCEAVYEMDPEIIIYYCAGAVLGEEAEKIGLRSACEIFADRAYEDDLSLRSRKLEGAMVTDEDEAIRRVLRMVKEGKVRSYSGKDLDIRGDTLCVHGDGPNAIAFAKRISEALKKEGVEIRAFE